MVLCDGMWMDLDREAGYRLLRILAYCVSCHRCGCRRYASSRFRSMGLEEWAVDGHRNVQVLEGVQDDRLQVQLELPRLNGIRVGVRIGVPEEVHVRGMGSRDVNLNAKRNSM
jgi:hypothetical protein